MKSCSKCNSHKSLGDFYDRGDGKGPQSWCKECVKEGRRNYVKNNPEKIRAADRKVNFGIDQGQYNTLFLEQDGCCAICKRHQSFFTKNFGIDHDHGTGEFRGLLCTNCNTALGKFEDSIESLESAIQYIKKSRDNSAKVLCLTRRGRRGGKYRPPGVKSGTER